MSETPKLKKWSVWGKVYATKFLGTFEAATADEAEQKAMEENGQVAVCNQCASEVSDPEIDSCEVEEDAGP